MRLRVPIGSTLHRRRVISGLIGRPSRRIRQWLAATACWRWQVGGAAAAMAAVAAAGGGDGCFLIRVTAGWFSDPSLPMWSADPSEVGDGTIAAAALLSSLPLLVAAIHKISSVAINVTIFMFGVYAPLQRQRSLVCV